MGRETEHQNDNQNESRGERAFSIAMMLFIVIFGSLQYYGMVSTLLRLFGVID